MTKIWEHLLTQAYVQVKKDACQPKKNQAQLVSSNQGKGHCYSYGLIRKRNLVYNISCSWS